MSKRAKVDKAQPVKGREGTTQLADGALVTFVERPFGSTEQRALFGELLTGTNWQQRTLNVRGKKVRPRKRAVRRRAPVASEQLHGSSAFATHRDPPAACLRLRLAADSLDRHCRLRRRFRSRAWSATRASRLR